MPLNGDLKDLPVTGLLQLLMNESMSGALTVRNGRDEVRVFLEDGDIVFASDGGRMQRALRFISMWEAVAEGPLEVCADRARKEGRYLEEVLEDGGYLLDETLEQLAHEVARETLYDLFLLNRGPFAFDDRIPEIPMGLETRLHVMEILMEGARRRDETEALSIGLPEESKVLKIAGTMKEHRGIQIAPDQWRLLSFIDGRRSLRQVIHETGLCRYDAYTILQSLVEQGLIEAAGQTSKQPAQDKASKARAVAAGRAAGTILVVDDMVQIRNILKFNLVNEGYRVVAAQDGEEALDHVAKGKGFDLVLLDVMMPRMDGYEVIRKLRKEESTQSVPVIFLTAKAQKADILKGIEAGADDYVVKPYRFTTLKQKIERLLLEKGASSSYR
jgi:CheY-like chemotaxis protein